MSINEEWVVKGCAVKCGVGQDLRCSDPATHVIAVAALSEGVFAPEKSDGGVVFLCHYHGTTAPADWELQSARKSDTVV